MPWDDIEQLEHQLAAALRDFDWTAADQLCASIAGRLPGEPGFPERAARSLLQHLRRKRRFATMGILAEALLQSGLRTPQVRRQYAQALIDQGMLTAAELVLQSLIQDSQVNAAEIAEARGLLGRIYKQLYVNGRPNAAHLKRAYTEYSFVYTSNPDQYTWHGINMVALLARAEEDGIPLQGVPDYRELARQILYDIAAKEEHSTDPLPSWDLATELEALVALGRNADAERKANLYADAPTGDAFEYASTLRQLQELWGLDNRTPPGSSLFPILRAAQIRREGGGLSIPLEDAQQDLEKVFGDSGSVSLKWYLEGLARGKSVCRVEFANGRGNGTGWLVKSTDFFPGDPPRLLVLTNSHVVSTTFPGAIRPPGAVLNFQLLGKRIPMKSIAWFSPVSELDATFLELAEPAGCDAMPLAVTPVELTDPAPRMYIIGHPGARDLEFSLQDNRLIGCNEQKLHYRTPTEGGSSGSPVFDPVGWHVVALHHAGAAKMPKLGGPPDVFYEANEGISILAIQKATQTKSLEVHA